MNISVKKRNGDTEPYQVEKIREVIRWATEGIEEVDSNLIEIRLQLNLRDGITTDEIHDCVTDVARDLITEETPNYQDVASRLLNYRIRKQVWGGKIAPKLLDFIKARVADGTYSADLLSKYSEADINKIGEYVNHERDFLHKYCGIKQLVDKYLISNRSSKTLHETPQFLYVGVAMAAYQNYPAKTRLKWVKKAYNAYSLHKISLPTPILAGLRTPRNAFSSCMLAEVDDDLDSIFANISVTGLATSDGYGIGLNLGRIRAIGSSIRGGQTISTGVIPFLKTYESAVKATMQGAARGGSATVNFPFWHYEIEDIIQLKQNTRTDETAVRKLDYCIGFSKLFYQRAQKNEDITLFSPHEVRDLYDAFGHPEFDELYLKKESDPSIKMKKKINAFNFFKMFIKERVETGRIYILNVDNVNSHGAFKDSVKMTNLCVEVQHPLTPIYDFNDPDGEIGICILSSINLMRIKNHEDMMDACEVAVRTLEEVIDIQKYFNKAAENFAKKRRSLGIGITNLAAYLAHKGVGYNDPEALNVVDEVMESFQFSLLSASVKLAKERGPCEKFHLTHYADGKLPIDHYNKKVDKIVSRQLSLDWETLRASIKEHGLRHSTVSCFMPVESSSLIQSQTNGIEPARKLLTYKKSKTGTMPVVVEGIKKYGKNYSLAFELKSNTGLINVNAVVQKYGDMGISTNVYYRYADFPNQKLPDSTVMKDIIYAYSMGVKSMYYNNTDDGDVQSAGQESGCSSGACTL